MKKIVSFFVLILVTALFCTSCTDTSVSTKLTQEQYQQIDSWLMNYYKNYFNGKSWYVENTSLKYDEYVVVKLVATEYDYVQTLKENKRAAINFALSVCPNDNEEIYKLIDRSHIDVDIYDKYGNFVNASSCNIGYY